MTGVQTCALPIYKCTENLLINYNNIKLASQIYNLDNAIMPLMIHEHYHKFIEPKYYSIIINLLAEADYLENYIYGEQKWELYPIHCYLSCVLPSYYINKFSNGKKTIAYKELYYSVDMNRTSVKKNNKKNIDKTNDTLLKKNSNSKKKTIDEFIFMKDILED